MIEGFKVPCVTFKTRVRDESIQGPNPYRWEDVTSDSLLKGKRVVLFSLPGAFTPTCSTKQLPGYEDNYEEILNREIDEVYCISVNDSFVMNAWAEHLGIENIKMIPDGNGELTKKMGMDTTFNNRGFGMRSWRYSAVINDMTVENVFIEPDRVLDSGPDPFEVSDADTMIEYLDEDTEQ